MTNEIYLLQVGSYFENGDKDRQKDKLCLRHVTKLNKGQPYNVGLGF